MLHVGDRQSKAFKGILCKMAYYQDKPISLCGSLSFNSTSVERHALSAWTVAVA